MPRRRPDLPREEGPRAAHAGVIRRLLPYLWPAGRWDLRLRVILAAVLLVVAKLLTVYTPFLYKRAVDLLEQPAAQVVALPLALLAAYGLARFSSVAFAQLRDWVFTRVSQHALRTLALQTFRHLHRLSLRFHLERRTGGLSRAIERGTRAIDFMLRFMLFNILPTIFELGLVTVIFAAHFGSGYMLLLVASVALYIALSVTITEWRTKFRRAMNTEDSRANARAVDSLLNYETVKYFANEEHEARHYDATLARYQTAAVKSQGSLAFLNAAQALVVNAALAAAMVMTALDHMAGRLTLGDLVLANSLMIQLFVPLNLLGFVYREIKQALIDMEYLFGLLDTPEEVQDEPDAAPLQIRGGEIRFENVGFAYDARRPVLKRVNFIVPAGHTVAVVGPSGAGKSTLSRLLYRFYDVTGGRILIDGQDIAKVTQKSLRAAIGIVPQDTVLFNDTIAYNIRYGRPEASDAQVAEAARLARIDDFIRSLPDGYETMVGERGLKLSGGEKQRVAIARTILKNPPILLLDEATSALDSHTESEIQEALEQVARDRTTLIIAHRLSTVVGADRILVMVDGRIVESGRHEELLVAEGVYAAMWARQQAEREEEAPDSATVGTDL